MFKDAFKRWNRRRLDKRRLKQSGRQLAPINAASLLAALGAKIEHVHVRHLVVATHLSSTHHSASHHAGSSRAWQALMAAVEELPAGMQITIAVASPFPEERRGCAVMALPVSRDAGHSLRTAMQAAKSHGATHLIWIDQDCIVEPHALNHLLKVSAAARHQALVDAVHFPDEAPKPFDPNSLKTPWVSTRCLLVPAIAFGLLDRLDLTAWDHASLSEGMSSQAKARGLALLSCPTALVCPSPDKAPKARLESQDNVVSIVIRHHDSCKLAELRRCLFSIACSTYQHTEALVVCQSFPQVALAPIQYQADLLLKSLGLRVRILNPGLPKDVDHRSQLLNTGIAAACGRYLAFLDYDDCIHPAAYDHLIDACQASGSHIAFGDIAIKKASIVGEAIIVRSRSLDWGTRNQFDLLYDNCCPIHSYVIDRAGIPASVLRFDTALSKYEDYDFLVRVCSQYRSDFSLIGEVVGDYYIKEDGSNSVITASSFSTEARQAWQASKQTVHERRDQTQLGPPALAQANDALREAGMPLLEQGATIYDLNLRSAPLRRLRQAPNSAPAGTGISQQ